VSERGGESLLQDDRLGVLDVAAGGEERDRRMGAGEIG
jgi:hypothetical protein